jgi:hypothetical protein
MESHSCIGFALDCETFAKGVLVVAIALLLFIGSVWVMLSAVFGRRMGYLVLMIALSGWMILLSSLWLFGFWSQGIETPTNLGPRGTEPGWIPVEGRIEPGSEQFPVAEQYPAAPWRPLQNETSSIQSVSSAVAVFMAEQANEELGKVEGEVGAVTSSEFTVEDIRFASTEDASLAAARSFYLGGGPEVTVLLRFDGGSVPRYSYMFLLGSIVLFALHVPLLDRAEKQRKEILTGGEAPPWYGPA